MNLPQNEARYFPEDASLNSKIVLYTGDITKLKVDCIVNAAHPGLTGGGGVDGFIHEKAGTDLIKACETLGGCDFGEAKLTKGYQLPAKYIIHVVGPSRNKRNPSILKLCYTNSLVLASQNNFKSIAFPCISTGNYEFDPILACEIAVKSVREWLEQNKQTTIQTVIFCCFTVRDEIIYEEILPNYF